MEIPAFLFFMSLWAATSQARISVMYAHDKLSDLAAQQCFVEMYPKGRKIEIQESDESCIIFCLFRKIGIMDSNGVISLENYKKRIQITHKADIRGVLFDYGNTCLEATRTMPHKQDVCKKAKAFNDCTHLYRMLLNKK